MGKTITIKQSDEGDFIGLFFVKNIKLERMFIDKVFAAFIIESHNKIIRQWSFALLTYYFITVM